MDEQDSIVTGTVSDAASSILAEDTAGSRAYLKASFLSSAVLALWNARQEAGLTQAQVAERLNTKQSAIARMESDFSGSMSLHRYVDYSLACGVLPFDVQLGNINALREFSRLNPEAPRTIESYNAWNRSMQPTLTTALPSISESIARAAQSTLLKPWVYFGSNAGNTDVLARQRQTSLAAALDSPGPNISTLEAPRSDYVLRQGKMAESHKTVA